MDRKPTYELLEQRVKELEKETVKRKQAEEDLDRIFNLSLDMLCIASEQGVKSLFLTKIDWGERHRAEGVGQGANEKPLVSCLICSIGSICLRTTGSCRLKRFEH